MWKARQLNKLLESDKRVQKTILPNLWVTLSASSTTYAVWLMTKMMKKRRMKILARKVTF